MIKCLVNLLFSVIYLMFLEVMDVDFINMVLMYELNIYVNYLIYFYKFY